MEEIAARQRRITVFIDESGVSKKPRCAPVSGRRATPGPAVPLQVKAVLRDRRDQLLALLHPALLGLIKSLQIVEFLKVVQVTIGRKLRITWDRLRAHRPKLIRDNVHTQRGQSYSSAWRIEHQKCR
jgi:hypothetical protein